MEKVIGITEGKYMDTHIDTILILFSDTKQESFVSEYPVPKDMPYILLFSQKEDSDFPSWIEVVNPKGVLDTKNPYLPDLNEFEYNRKRCTLLKLIHEIIQR